MPIQGKKRTKSAFSSSSVSTRSAVAWSSLSMKAKHNGVFVDYSAPRSFGSSLLFFFFEGVTTAEKEETARLAMRWLLKRLKSNETNKKKKEYI